MRADAAAAALLALALHAFVQTKTTAIAVLAKTLAPPVSADAAATAFLAVALAPTVDADAAPPALLALAFHTTMGAYSGTATCLLACFACFDFISSAYWHRGSSVVYVWFKLNVFALTNNKGGRAV